MLIRLLVWEGMSADYSILKMHMQGLEAIFSRKGGLMAMTNQDAALALTLYVKCRS